MYVLYFSIMQSTYMYMYMYTTNQSCWALHAEPIFFTFLLTDDIPLLLFWELLLNLLNCYNIMVSILSLLAYMYVHIPVTSRFPP